jgi:hypothetical protein
VPRTTESLRITFAYDLEQPDGAVRLVRVERVRAVAPGISTPPPQPGQSGAWFEVRDRQGDLLYYQAVHDPMPTTREVFADASGKPGLSRVPLTRSTGEFELLVPDLRTAARFSFHATPPLRPGERPVVAEERGAAKQLTQLSFDELRRHATPIR